MSSLAQRSLTSKPGQEVLSGTITGVRFYNPKNGWAVLQVASAGGAVTAVGALVNPREGDEYEFRGRWVTHSKFGKQFQFDSAELRLPATRKGVIRYLSDIATGVGPVRAAKVVEALGEDCLEKLQRDPGLLDTLGFLTAAQRDEIRAHLRKNKTLAELSALICREGITPSLAARIVKHYGPDAVGVVKENPYRLADDIEGIGFLTADRIASAVGVAPDSPYRVQAAVRHVLKEAENEGHCCLRPSDLVRQVPSLLLDADIMVSDVAEAVATLIDAGALVREGDDIYPAELNEAERQMAECIKTLLSNPCDVPVTLESIVQSIEREKEAS